MPPARQILAILIALAAPTRAGAGAPPPASDPEGTGFSAPWLSRITSWYRAQIDAGALTGAVVAIARSGRLAYLQRSAPGTARGRCRPMRYSESPR